MYETSPLGPFDVETASTQLGAVGFSYTRMTAQNWHRTPDHVRTDGADPLMVNIRFEGMGRGEADGRAVEAPPGTVVLSDFARPQSIHSERCFTAVLAIPRAVAEQRLPDVRTLHGLVIQPAAATLLRSHALALTRTLDAGLLARQAAGLGRIALDLLEIGVARSTSNRLTSSGAVATGVRAAAEAAIERMLDSHTLTVDNLVRWIGVSRSTLYRSFDPDGIQAFILKRRLERIASELRQGTRASLADLADRWGFREVSHMSRLFRATFEQAPGDYRAWHMLLDDEMRTHNQTLDYPPPNDSSRHRQPLLTSTATSRPEHRA